MARSRTKTAEGTADATETAEVDVFDQAIAQRAEQERQAEAQAVVQQVAAATAIPENGHAAHHAPSHAAKVERKPFTRPVDPFGFESIAGNQKNRVQLLKSEGEGAWVIRFAHNPNDDKGLEGETYSKANPHPVLKMLKSEGFRWGFDGGDGKGGWGKGFTGDAYGQDHIEARRVLQAAAEMIGAPKEERGRIPD